MNKAPAEETTRDDADTEKLMLQQHVYPDTDSENFQTLIYVKREFYINKIPERPPLKTYQEIKELRDRVCSGEIKLSVSQNLLSNFINPNTPYRGLLIYWGTGVGKSCAAIAIAEKFKGLVEKYGTKIHVLVPGPLNKQEFLQEIIRCTGETYLKIHDDKTAIISEADKAKHMKTILAIISQYYRIMSYSSFYKKVLGEKIKEKQVVGNKVKVSNRKTETGEYERDLSTDRIYSLDNTVLIADEAHSLTNNERGLAFKKIIKNSRNLKIVLLTATPMKNLGDDIVELINYMRPHDAQMERDKIFTSQRNHTMDLRVGGETYFRKMIRGYVSYLRAFDPITFAERIDVGEVPMDLSFTRVIRCLMLDFQLATYHQVVTTLDDSLDRSSEAAANFVFPGLSRDRAGAKIVGYYGIEGIHEIQAQLKSNADNLNRQIAAQVLGDKNIKDGMTLMYLTNNNKTISGDVFHEKYLQYFSVKFHAALTDINRMVYGDRGAGLVFVYSNLVKSGIELFIEVLQQNGYLEYQENINSYNIKSDTRCYFCDRRYGNHTDLGDIPNHDFRPATYLTVTGKSDDSQESIPEEKHWIIKNVFNRKDNKFGKLIKIIAGSKVMNEGITLVNIAEIHVLDVHFTLGKVDQVLGRGIRFCKHYDLSNEKNVFPKVYIKKYVVALKTGISTEEELYRKAESKYKLIKRLERILQEESIDCPLNMSGNVFREEIEKYGRCGEPDQPECPAICGYMKCHYKCGDKLLNERYYDPDRIIYKKVAKSDLDYSTYNNFLAKEEIDHAKTKIKEMFGFNPFYDLEEIVEYVYNSFMKERKEMFDEYYVYQALHDMIPITTNDFNNFHDTVVDKYNRQGYLIYRGRYYIFQHFDENESLPMYYRKNYQITTHNRLTLKNYVKNVYKPDKQKVPEKEQQVIFSVSYDFDSIQEYYDAREEFDYVGTIDRASKRSASTRIAEVGDEFKIRLRRPKVLAKKRETGIPSFKGAVCKTSKGKEFLEALAAKLNIEYNDNIVRGEICDKIRDKLFDLEKYSTQASGKKMTYLIIPANHPVFPFPLNLEDRVQHIISKVQSESRSNIRPKISIHRIKSGRFPDIEYVEYLLEYGPEAEPHKRILEQNAAIKRDNKWLIRLT